jgi:hypothetical protein
MILKGFFELHRFCEENQLRLLKAFLLSATLLLAACAGNRNKTGPPAGYVEIDNPGQTLSPDAPAKIWVPRSYVESGIPRGGELIKKGTEKVMQNFRKTPPQPQQAVSVQQPVAAAAVLPSSAPVNLQTAVSLPSAVRAPIMVLPPSTLKNRIALLELGQNILVQPLYENMRRTGMGGLIDPTLTAFLAQYATITSEAEKAAFATRLQQDYGANTLIYLSAPDGVAPGKTIFAEFYDTMGGGLVRKFDAVIPLSLGSEESERKAAIAAIMTTFTEKIKELAALLPWYGRITAVEGRRAYIAAGKEAGMSVGQVLKIYHNGKFVQGLGFAPGERVGTMVVEGFVGPNGSFGTIQEGQGAQATDVVYNE